MPEQNNQVAIPEHIDKHLDTLTKLATTSLDTMWMLIKNGASEEQIEDAIIAIDSHVREIELFAEQQAGIIAGLTGTAQTLKDQRDQLATAYARAHEYGIMHAQECEACMEDAEVENLANHMLEVGPEMVAEEMHESMSQKLIDAEQLYEEWLDQDNGESQQAERQLHDNIGGLIPDIDEEDLDYDMAQIKADQDLAKQISASNDPEQLEFEANAALDDDFGGEDDPDDDVFDDDADDEMDEERMRQKRADEEIDENDDAMWDGA